MRKFVLSVNENNEQPIGNTKSGKPIYSYHATYYKDFTRKDHADASAKHMELSNTYKKDNPKLADIHKKLSLEHDKANTNNSN